MNRGPAAPTDRRFPTTASDGSQPQSVSSPALIVAVYAGLVLVWGTTWLGIRIGLDVYPPFFALAVRFCIAGPGLLLLMKLRRDRIPWERRHQPFFFTLGFLGFVLSYGLVYWGEQYVTSGLTAVIFALLPLFTGIVAHYLLRTERLAWTPLAGLAVGLAGIVIINSADLEQLHPLAPLAALLLIISPLATSFTTVLSKQRVHDYPILSFAALPMTYGGIMNVGLWLLLERDQPLTWSWPGVASIAYLTVLGSMVTFVGYYWLLRQMAVGRANLIAYLTPLVALAVGHFLGGEVLTTRMLLGSALVLAGVAIANRSQRGSR